MLGRGAKIGHQFDRCFASKGRLQIFIEFWQMSQPPNEFAGNYDGANVVHGGLFDDTPPVDATSSSRLPDICSNKSHHGTLNLLPERQNQSAVVDGKKWRRIQNPLIEEMLLSFEKSSLQTGRAGFRLPNMNDDFPSQDLSPSDTPPDNGGS